MGIHINMEDNMVEERLPDTLTPKDCIISPPFGSDFPRKMPWGRLISCKKYLESIDLIESNGWTFGRSETCSKVVTTQCPKDLVHNVSKVHFCIEKDEDNLVYITDLSKNGTFINKIRLGQGNRKILKNDDVIAVTLTEKAIYVFQLLQVPEEFLPPTLIQRYANVRHLGSGSCGDVRLVKDRDTFKQYAVKKIIMGQSNSSQMNKINHPTKIDTEIKILRSLNHPCVVRCEHVEEYDRKIYLILEYMAGGELTNRIMADPMSEDSVKFYFLQMLFAVQYLHARGVIHRDLKPQNILLLDHRPETILKITDFGLSKVSQDSNLTTMCGTMHFVAPEVLDNRFRECGEYGKKVDVWSLGVILYFMMSRTLPFRDETGQLIKQKILQGAVDMTGDAWDYVSSELKDLIQKILVVRPKRRASTLQIMCHPWIKIDYGVKIRVDNLMKQEGLANPLQDIVLEPPEKKFKFSNQYSSEGSSDDMDRTLVYDDSSSGSTYSRGSTLSW